MDKIISRQLVTFVVSSSSCLTRNSKSKGSVPEVDWVGGPHCLSGSRGLDLVLETLFRVIVIEVFDIWAVPREQVSWKAAEQRRSTVKGLGSEKGEG